MTFDDFLEWQQRLISKYDHSEGARSEALRFVSHIEIAIEYSNANFLDYQGKTKQWDAKTNALIALRNTVQKTLKSEVKND